MLWQKSFLTAASSIKVHFSQKAHVAAEEQVLPWTWSLLVKSSRKKACEKYHLWYMALSDYAGLCQF